MHRCYCPDIKICRNRIAISDAGEMHHIRGVLRLKLEDWVSVFDGRGNEYSGPIRESSSRAVVIEVREKRLSAADSDINITVACAIPKRQKMDDIVDKLTQLGVSRIVPLITKNTVVILDDKKEEARRQHWEKIAVSASKQSMRNTLPVVDPVRQIREILLQAADFDLKVIPTLSGGASLPLKDVLKQKKFRSILVMIGPEGDFTADEIDLAKRHGCIPVSLGSLVLRVETAALAVAGFIRLSLTNGTAR